MTAITQNLPWFIRNPGVNLIGEKCYASLVEELHLGDSECLKFALSKGLGVGIVVGGSIAKVPQALNILFAGSARGLSLSAYVLETLAYAITLVYSYRNEFPFSTYGENFFLTLQNSVITTLIVYFPSTALKSGRSNVGGAFITILALIAGAALLLVTPAPTLSLLQAATVPLGVLSKLPQITANYRARSTGQLSVVAVGSQIAGCLARLFTTATEVGDTMLFLGFAVALVLNCVLGAQMWMYWNADRDDVEMDMGRVQVSEKGKEWARSGQVDIVIPPGTPTAPSSNTPSGRRWSRKVD